MDASLHQMEHLVPDRGQVQLMGNVELSTVVDQINVPVHLQSDYPQTGLHPMQPDEPQTGKVEL